MTRITSLAAVAAATLVVGHIAAADPLTLTQSLLGAALGVLAVTAAARYIALKLYHRLPILEYALVQFYVYWGLPTLTGALDASREHPSNITAALVACVTTAAAAVVGYCAGKRAGRSLSPLAVRAFPDRPAWSLSLVVAWLTVAVVAQTGVLDLVVGAGVRKAVAVGTSFFPLLTFVASRSTRVMWAAATVLSVAGLTTGMAENTLSPLLCAGVLHVIQRRVVPWPAVIAAVALLSVLQPVKHVYRSLAWGDTHEEHISRDAIRSLTLWAEAATKYWSGDVEGVGGSSIAGRTNELPYIARTIAYSPHIVPHEYGQNWTYLLIAPIPRALMPGKPDQTEITNDRFNITFAIHTRAATETSTMSFPLPADGYWNLAWFGVLLVGAAVGVLLGLLSYGLPPTHWGTLSVAVASFVGLHAHTHLIANFGGVLQLFVGIAAACWAASVAAGLLRIIKPRAALKSRRVPAQPLRLRSRTSGAASAEPPAPF